MSRWLTAPVPLGRVAAFRTLVYLFVIADLLVFTPWVRAHADVPGELYQPLLVGRLLPLPTPSAPLVWGVFAALLVSAAVAAAGRLPRLAGAAVALLYFQWMIIAFSYGKVDHDRVGLLVALAVLATVGRARHGDLTRSEAAGWALRATQLAVVATYFLAAWAKLRYGGLDWLTGATLTWAFVRRGTVLAELMLAAPWVLIVAQIGIVAFELLSPVVFLLRERWRYAMVGGFYFFHLFSFATITISFLPHVVAMACFLPLERVRPVARLRLAANRLRLAARSSALRGGQHAGGGAAGHPMPVPRHPPVGGPGQRAHRPEGE